MGVPDFWRGVHPGSPPKSTPMEAFAVLGSFVPQGH